MSTIRPLVLKIAVAVLALTGTALAADEDVPTRVCPVKGGYVVLRGGVMKDAAPPLPFGKLKYPSQYFVQLEVHRPGPLWIEADWTFPGKPEKAYRSRKVDAEGDKVPVYYLWKKSFGVIEGDSIGIHLRFFEDKGFTKMVGETRRSFTFPADQVAWFKQDWLSNETKFISGWPDEEDPTNKVPGTTSNAQLQADILWRIATLEMKAHPACRMEALRAEQFEPAASATLALLTGEPKVIAEHRLKEGKAGWERWTVRACDAEAAYEVLLLPSPGGGTDLAVAPIPPTETAAVEAVPSHPGAP